MSRGGVAADGTEGIANQPTRTNTHIDTQKNDGKERMRQTRRGKISGDGWMKGVGGCVSPAPPGALCAAYVQWLALI